ncbi:MAG: DUF1460 domain-containing protein [Bacteroidales bacterium]
MNSRNEFCKYLIMLMYRTCLNNIINQGINSIKLTALIWTLQFHPLLHAQPVAKIIFTPEDREIFTGRLLRFSSQAKLPAGELVIRLGESFIGTPYVAKTLEVQPEQLVVNLQGFDCTTFVESCMALMHCVKMGDTSSAVFSTELMKLRYRKGIPEGYSSRLHYFTEWIVSNARKGYLKDITADLGGVPYDVELDFMSTHSSLYMQLTHDSSLVGEIRSTERSVSAIPFHYIPTDMLDEAENGIRDGDIIAVTSTINGLDIAHTGLALRKEGRIHMLHASSLHKQVEVTSQPLQDYLMENKGMSGVMVIRPLELK